ncbi:PREDICTED: uncharacterized F-box/LRR-repeat protein C02F5.7-like [Priapulus caudatus]|uniref:Uncharacterized F-box/LRR-repeat protein C02F5.7-like n=1 Tax=Priapulus caudatus TaxID=37621 RepID=A0ABM1DZ09_PRICU|nr:PREDICTED: uncharacterized F-box/LRR-repeat protein C02F5.7-like [Priapulus caudatus]
MDIRKSSIFNIAQDAQVSINLQGRQSFEQTGMEAFGLNMEKMPDKVLLKIFSYMSHGDIMRMARVCKKWRLVAYDSRLWQVVSFRPEYNGLQVLSLEALLTLISVRFGPLLRYIELPMELITPAVLHELATKCPNLHNLTLDFSTAMQLHDFNELREFPQHLTHMTICLSEVIFMEGFMRKIYGFVALLEVMHLVGTYERIDQEEEIYEVINIHKLKSYIPNLRMVNMYGVSFVDDSHVESISSNCIHLEGLAVNFCLKFKGSSLKTLLQRCRKLRTLLMQHTDLQDEYLMNVDWAKTAIENVDVSSTLLSAEALTDMLTRVPGIVWFAAAHVDGMNSSVVEQILERADLRHLSAIDVSHCENLSEDVLLKLLRRIAPQLQGMLLGGFPQLLEQFWMCLLPLLKNIK